MKHDICENCLKEINTHKEGPGQCYDICNKCSILDITEYLSDKLKQINKQPHIKNEKMETLKIENKWLKPTVEMVHHYRYFVVIYKDIDEDRDEYKEICLVHFDDIRNRFVTENGNRIKYSQIEYYIPIPEAPK